MDAELQAQYIPTPCLVDSWFLPLHRDSLSLAGSAF